MEKSSLLTFAFLFLLCSSIEDNVATPPVKSYRFPVHVWVMRNYAETVRLSMSQEKGSLVLAFIMQEIREERAFNQARHHG